MQGRRDEAIAVNEAARQVQPLADALTLKNLALLYRDAGNTELALQRAREAQALDPNDPGLAALVTDLDRR